VEDLEDTIDPTKVPSIFESTEPATGAIADTAEESEIYRLLLVNQRPRWWATREQRRVYAKDLIQWHAWCREVGVHTLSGRVLEPGEQEGEGLWDDELGRMAGDFGVLGDGEGGGDGDADEEDDGGVGATGRRHATRRSRRSGATSLLQEGVWV